uniref:Metadherin b n=1 Tax=Nothobranchius korthausae TaxID=1143690 RepID=A0A1A8GJD0_9TELE
MEQWQEAASQQLELLTTRLNEALSKGLVWLRHEFGLDLGLKPELIPPWVIICAACTGVLLLVVLWASVCRAVFKKRVVVSTSDDSVDGKRVTIKAAKPEEPKKKKKKAEKKAQPNGRANAEPQEEAIVSEELVPHHHPPPEVKTDKAAAETKKSKKKAKQAVKETKAGVGDGKEPEEGTWETKVSNKEKREQRKKDKGSSDGSASPGGGNSPVSTPPAQPKASTAPPTPAPASQKKKKGESAHVKAEKLGAVSAANSSEAAEVAAATTGMSIKVAPKTTSWSTQRQPAPLLRTGIDDSWTLISSSDLVVGPLPRRGVGSAPPQPAGELPWLGQARADEWSGLNGGSADPSSDWDAPSEAWGNYEEPSPEPPLPQLAMVNLIGAAEDDEDDKEKEDGATDGAAKSKKKKKKKKKSAEEEGTAGQVEETMKEMPPAASGKKQPPAQENAAAVQPVRAAAVEARGQRQVKDTIPQKPPVTQVPPKPTDGEPTAKQNNFPAPTVQKKPEENQASKPAKKKKARRET